MESVKELEEKLRESASIGDEDTVKQLINNGVDVNTQNKVNGWSPLHWAAKRGHERITQFLISQGADGELTTSKGETALELAKTPEIKKLLGGDANGDTVCMKEDLPITPNYISNPPFPYMTQSQFKSISDSPVNLSMVGTNQRQTPSPQHPNHQTLQNQTPPLPLLGEGKEDENELVVKVRVANSAEMDFIEIELDKDNLTFEALISIMCQELDVNRKLVQKIRKLPDTIVRKDKDVRRLNDFQELELVLTNKAISESSRNYANNQGPQPRPVDVVY